MSAFCIFERSRCRGKVRVARRLQACQLPRDVVEITLCPLTSEQEIAPQISQGSRYTKLRFVEPNFQGFSECRRFGLSHPRRVERGRGFGHGTVRRIANLCETRFKSGYLSGVAVLPRKTQCGFSCCQLSRCSVVLGLSLAAMLDRTSDCRVRPRVHAHTRRLASCPHFPEPQANPVQVATKRLGPLDDSNGIGNGSLAFKPIKFVATRFERNGRTLRIPSVEVISIGLVAKTLSLNPPVFQIGDRALVVR